MAVVELLASSQSAGSDDRLSIKWPDCEVKGHMCISVCVRSMAPLINALFCRTESLDGPSLSSYVKCKSTSGVPKIKCVPGNEKAEILLAVSASSHYS